MATEKYRVMCCSVLIMKRKRMESDIKSFLTLEQPVLVPKCHVSSLVQHDANRKVELESTQTPKHPGIQ